MHIFMNNYAQQRDIPLFFAAGKEEESLSAMRIAAKQERLADCIAAFIIACIRNIYAMRAERLTDNCAAFKALVDKIQIGLRPRKVALNR